MLHSTLVRPLAALFAFTLVNLSLVAQTMTISPGGTVRVGDTVTITYHDPAKAGSTVMVEIGYNVNPPVLVVIPIVLDASGEGSGTWVAARTRRAFVTAPDVPEQRIEIR